MRIRKIIMSKVDSDEQTNMFGAFSEKIGRIYHHHEKCEEYKNGMWKAVPVKHHKKFIEASAILMKKPDKFMDAMRLAFKKWPISCEANLSDKGTNRRAWIGHAGCFLATGSTEDLTRMGWHTLTKDQQDKANAAADEVIAEWEKLFATTGARNA